MVGSARRNQNDSSCARTAASITASGAACLPMAGVSMS